MIPCSLFKALVQIESPFICRKMSQPRQHITIIYRTLKYTNIRAPLQIDGNPFLGVGIWAVVIWKKKKVSNLNISRIINHWLQLSLFSFIISSICTTGYIFSKCSIKVFECYLILLILCLHIYSTMCFFFFTAFSQQTSYMDAKWIFSIFYYKIFKDRKSYFWGYCIASKQ